MKYQTQLLTFLLLLSFQSLAGHTTLLFEPKCARQDTNSKIICEVVKKYRSTDHMTWEEAEAGYFFATTKRTSEVCGFKLTPEYHKGFMAMAENVGANPVLAFYNFEEILKDRSRFAMPTNLKAYCTQSYQALGRRANRPPGYSGRPNTPLFE